MNSLSMRAALGSAILLAAATASSAGRAQTSPADAALTCQQIADGVNHQNAIIKQKNEDKSELQSARPDPGAADPAIQERLDDIAANKATTRANTLVALGRQKKCFR